MTWATTCSRTSSATAASASADARRTACRDPLVPPDPLPAEFTVLRGLLGAWGRPEGRRMDPRGAGGRSTLCPYGFLLFHFAFRTSRFELPLIAPKKSLGQNFLRDPNTIRRIAQSVRAPDGAAVVEIGPGTGALTGELLARHPALIAIELDTRAIEVLRARFPALDVRHGDVLDVDFGALATERGGPLYVVGNLPYYITSQILFGLLDARASVREAVVMMQLEVAERLVARPRTKAYGILSVALQRYCEVELLFRVPPTVFYPQPSVTSAVVRLTMRADAPPPSPFEDRLRGVIRAAFNQRRKMLRGALSAYGAVPEPWATQRAEELTDADFEALTHALTPARAG